MHYISLTLSEKPTRFRSYGQRIYLHQQLTQVGKRLPPEYYGFLIAAKNAAINLQHTIVAMKN